MRLCEDSSLIIKDTSANLVEIDIFLTTTVIIITISKYIDQILWTAKSFNLSSNPSRLIFRQILHNCFIKLELCQLIAVTKTGVANCQSIQCANHIFYLLQAFVLLSDKVRLQMIRQLQIAKRANRKESKSQRAQIAKRANRKQIKSIKNVHSNE